MSSKYTRSKQGRSHGAYQRRLRARGLNSAPPMPDAESLRRKQTRRNADGSFDYPQAVAS